MGGLAPWQLLQMSFDSFVFAIASWQSVRLSQLDLGWVNRCCSRVFWLFCTCILTISWLDLGWQLTLLYLQLHLDNQLTWVASWIDSCCRWSGSVSHHCDWPPLITRLLQVKIQISETWKYKYQMKKKNKDNFCTNTITIQWQICPHCTPPISVEVNQVEEILIVCSGNTWWSSR